MNSLQTGSFLETESCNGPRRIPSQPNRESPGVILTDIQNKYIPEFELPYRNIERYIQEMNNNWDRLNPQQRAAAQASFKRMGMLKNSSQKETFTATAGSVTDCAKYLAKSPETRPKELLSMLWNPTDSQKSSMTEGMNSLEAEELVSKLRTAVYDWTTDQSYGLYANWKSCSLVFFLVVLFLLIGLAGGLGANGRK